MHIHWIESYKCGIYTSITSIKTLNDKQNKNAIWTINKEKKWKKHIATIKVKGAVSKPLGKILNGSRFIRQTIWKGFGG